MVACTAPFLSGPRVQIGYALGKQVVNQNLALPVITPKFCTPPDSSVPREAFFQRWRTLEGGSHIHPSLPPCPSMAHRIYLAHPCIHVCPAQVVQDGGYAARAVQVFCMPNLRELPSVFRQRVT